MDGCCSFAYVGIEYAAQPRIKRNDISEGQNEEGI